MTPAVPRLAPTLVALTLLAGCGAIPDFRAPMLGGARPQAPAAPEPLAMAPLPATPGASGAGAAEAACLAAGQERGFQVQGVVGSSDVTGADGRAISRDVMLRVARGAQVFDLRCNYSYAEGQARVMAL